MSQDYLVDTRSNASDGAGWHANSIAALTQRYARMYARALKCIGQK